MFEPRYYEKQLKDAVIDITALWQDLNGKSILITGATGLIGSALTDVLCYANSCGLADMEVYAASRKVERLQQRFKTWETLHFIKYDATEELQWEHRFDYVIHCAGNAHPNEFGKAPVETMMGSILGVHNLLDYVRKNGNKCRMLYVSSSEVYGTREGSGGKWYSEEEYGRLDLLNARACYPSGKRAAETLCASYKAEYGLDIVIARPGHIYGPNVTETDSRASAQFFRDVIMDRDIVMKSQGAQLRSYCYIFDCVTALLTILLRGESGNAYNVSNRDSVATIRQLAEEIAKQSGRRVVNAMPTDFEAKSYNLMDVSALNAEKLEALGWRGRYDLRSGVKATLTALRERGKNNGISKEFF